jgi:phage repressor protein C with HTH and peptisase S24 domain
MPDLERAARLRQARANAGYARPVDAASAFGWKRSTYFSHENGHRGISRDQIMVYADAFHVERDWLAFGRGATTLGPRRITIEGYVTDLATIETAIGEPHQPLDETELPQGIDPERFSAFRVRGDWAYPVWFDRDVLLSARSHGPPEDYLGKRCVVRLKDRRLLVRTLLAGTRPGHFVLISHAAPPMIDIEIDEAAPIVWTKHSD